jgi:hypothetical protein
MAVACRTGFGIDNRLTLTNQTVEERTLTHIRATNYCYKTHSYFTFCPRLREGFSRGKDSANRRQYKIFAKITR